ncbi:Rz-like spanin [Pectobacterium phage Abuela]|uniref:Rz-like spanin n=3 Tax=unclassified Caudoviricetes TaxID=2788787 RepID=A0AB39AC07_9CAUD
MRTAAKGVLIIIVIIAVVGIFFAGYRTANNSWESKWADRDAADAKANQAFSEQQRRIEQDRQGAINAIQADAQKQIAKSKRAADAANAESERLQIGINDAIGRIKSGGSDTGTTSSGKAGDTSGPLLAELFREIDTAAGKYAEEADRAYNAGMTCEISYDAVKNGGK